MAPAQLRALEEALVRLACRVRWYYGDNREQDFDRPQECGYDEMPCDCPGECNEDRHHYVSCCVDGGDGFCRKCGYLMSSYEDQFDRELKDA